MRHYYRFMELEPVLEQEEDSVGETSPTSSMGSPSFSPPPDPWAQINGKEFHDPLSSHLLQEHLDLQRAYRLLELQVRNYDSRASRDLQKLKDTLPTQERLREELQRAKEREATLKGEIYDLHEQNELLEFRILELEECQENASTTRGGQARSRDVATETDDGVASLPAAAGGAGSQQDATQTQGRLGDAAESGDRAGASGSEPRLEPDTKDSSSEMEIKAVEEGEAVTAHSHPEDPDDSAPHPLSEGISCTLCRRLPRRRSYPEPAQPLPEALRKSKSDGEIMARKTGEAVERVADEGEGPRSIHRGVGTTPPPTAEEGVQVDLRQAVLPGEGVEGRMRAVRGMLSAIYGVLQETRVEVECTNSELREEVQTLESTVQRLKEEAARGLAGDSPSSGPPPVRRSRSLSFSKDCYCCSQDLQPALEEVISKLHQVMNLIIDTENTATLVPGNAGENKYDEVVLVTDKRTEEKTFVSEDKQVEENIVKYESTDNKNKEMKTQAYKITNSLQTPGEMENCVEESTTLPLLHPVGQQPTQTKDRLSPPLQKKALPNGTITTEQLTNDNVNSNNCQADWKPEPRNVDYDLARTSFESHIENGPNSEDAWKQQRIKESLVPEVPPLRGLLGMDYIDPRERFREYEDGVGQETDEAVEELTPLPEEKTKPVLRRWREQLLVRRDRVQPWRIEMLDFPKRLPSVV